MQILTSESNYLLNNKVDLGIWKNNFLLSKLYNNNKTDAKPSHLNVSYIYLQKKEHSVHWEQHSYKEMTKTSDSVDEVQALQQLHVEV